MSSPPHVTHLIQPLDVSVFGPVKNEWRKILKMYQIETHASVITKEDFPSLLAKIMLMYYYGLRQ